VRALDGIAPRVVGGVEHRPHLVGREAEHRVDHNERPVARVAGVSEVGLAEVGPVDATEHAGAVAVRVDGDGGVVEHAVRPKAQRRAPAAADHGPLDAVRDARRVEVRAPRPEEVADAGGVVGEVVADARVELDEERVEVAVERDGAAEGGERRGGPAATGGRVVAMEGDEPAREQLRVDAREVDAAERRAVDGVAGDVAAVAVQVGLAARPRRERGALAREHEGRAERAEHGGEQAEAPASGRADRRFVVGLGGEVVGGGHTRAREGVGL
jgi:hypothetical protein